MIESLEEAKSYLQSKDVSDFGFDELYDYNTEDRNKAMSDRYEIGRARASSVNIGDTIAYCISNGIWYIGTICNISEEYITVTNKNMLPGSMEISFCRILTTVYKVPKEFEKHGYGILDERLNGNKRKMGFYNKVENVISAGSIVEISGRRAVVTAIKDDIAYVVLNGNDVNVNITGIVRVVLIDGKFPDTFKKVGTAGSDILTLYEDEEYSDLEKRGYKLEEGTRFAYYGWPCTLVHKDWRRSELDFDKGVFGDAKCPYIDVKPRITDLINNYDIWEIGYKRPHIYRDDNVNTEQLPEYIYDSNTHHLKRINTRDSKRGETKTAFGAFVQAFPESKFHRIGKYDGQTVYLCKDTSIYYIGDDTPKMVTPFLSKYGNPVMYNNGEVVDCKTGMPLNISADVQEVYAMIPAEERTNEPIEVQVEIFKQRHIERFR